MKNIGLTLRKKLDFDDMINHFREKDIKFDIISEQDAKSFLENANYFFKIKAYRKNFDKKPNGKYINLDFSVLQDLSTIDMRLRYLVIQMSLDIEHTLKTKIHKDITEDPNENGYSIVTDFFAHTNYNKSDILRPIKEETNYNYGLYTTYKENIPIWVLFEVLSFGQFVRFVEFYYSRTNKSQDYRELNRILRYVKNIRNSAAHNSPLIMDIVRKNRKSFQPDSFITNFLSNITDISKDSRRNRLQNKKVHDLTSLLAVHYNFIQSEPMKNARYEDLHKLLKRASRNGSYYEKHPSLQAVYIYFKKIVDYITNKSYNTQ